MKFSHTLENGAAAPERIWQAWTEVSSWPLWDTELRAATIEGEFRLGAAGVLTPKKGPVSRFVVSELVANGSNALCIKLPGCTLSVRHAFSPDGASFTHEFAFEGHMAKAFGALLGPRLRQTLPGVMGNLREWAAE